jgi:glycine/D-amino acid oxidase-like deaminating enzyme
MSVLPDAVEYCVIGGGVHGLSTAWHLAGLLKAKGRGREASVVLLDKQEPGSGTSGIACGIVRNFYRSLAMTELVRLSLEIWESDPEVFGFRPAGYVAAVPKPQVSDLIAIHQKQQEVGYCSELHLGEADCSRHMRGLYRDFHCEGIEAVLHESKSGFAVPKQTIHGLTQKAVAAGVHIINGVEVRGFDSEGDQVQALETNQGRIRPDVVVVAAGPWNPRFWKLLGLPEVVEVNGPNGVERKPMWKYWQLREGTITLDEPYLTNDGAVGPVIHLDHTIPLTDPLTGDAVDPGPWGIYWKKEPLGIQGGGVPIDLGPEAEIEPYGRARQLKDEGFHRYFRAGLGWAMDRFRKPLGHDLERPNGGIGCFAADHYPVIDFVKSNVVMIADSNHGFKLLGAGREVAHWLIEGPRKVLEPFRFSRFAEGALHPQSNSPFPWN